MSIIFSCFRSKKASPNHDCHLGTHRLPPAALFPLQEYTAPSIHVWAGAIQVLNASESSGHRIRKVSHCKATRGPSSSSAADLVGHDGHEFLLVHVRHHNNHNHPSGKDAILRAERLSATPHSSGAHGGPPYITAHDRVSVSHDGTTDCLTRHIAPSYVELLTLSFPKPSEAPSVAHFAALLVTLNTHGPGGGSTTTSGPTGPVVTGITGGADQPSAWFAYSVVEVLKAIFGGKVKKNKAWAKLPYDGGGGGMRVDVDAVLRRYTRTWEDFSRRPQLGVGLGDRGTLGHDDSRSPASNSKPKVRRNGVVCEDGC